MNATAKRVDIIPAKRQAMILEWLRDRGATSIHELAEAIGASLSTIRRDLDHLTQVGALERTFGGAVLASTPPATWEMEPAVVLQIALPQKRAIGAAAAERITARDSVIFDSSSTVLEAARVAVNRALPLTVVTNGLDIAQLCATVPAMQVMVPGGTVRAGFPSLIGEPGREFLGTINADICFMGTHAITGNRLTEVSLEHSAMKRAMIQASRRRILLADSSKFAPAALCTTCELSAFDEFITDSGVSGEQLAGLQAMNVKVTVVPVERGIGA